MWLVGVRRTGEARRAQIDRPDRQIAAGASMFICLPSAVYAYTVSLRESTSIASRAHLDFACQSRAMSAVTECAA